jgi:hypothetical protein
MPARKNPERLAGSDARGSDGVPKAFFAQHLSLSLSGRRAMPGSSTTFALCSPYGLRGAFAAGWKQLRRGFYLAESSAHYLFNHSGSLGSILWFAKIRPCRGH